MCDHAVVNGIDSKKMLRRVQAYHNSEKDIKRVKSFKVINFIGVLQFHELTLFSEQNCSCRFLRHFLAPLSCHFLFKKGKIFPSFKNQKNKQKKNVNKQK